jgi:hypothetical protein
VTCTYRVTEDAALATPVTPGAVATLMRIRLIFVFTRPIARAFPGGKSRVGAFGPASSVSIMWRPLFFRRPHCFGCLCRLDSLRKRIEPHPQRLNLLALPIYDIAQFEVGALEERYLRFETLDCIAVHFDSVTVIGRCFGPFAGGGNN